jgi:hypothetical protein
VFTQNIGQPVTDGSITWTCQAISDASLRKTVLGIPTWTPETGITASGPSISGTLTSAVLSGGVDGQDYTVLVTANFSGTPPTSKTMVCILPVRRPVKVC